MGKLNCWNFMNCGRYPGGPKEHELGICPVTINTDMDGFLDGRAAGRACAYIEGSLCGGNIQGDYLSKKKHCEKCHYYKALRGEFGAGSGIHQFNIYLKRPVTQKKITPKNQPWVALNTSESDTAKAARERYSKHFRK